MAFVIIFVPQFFSNDNKLSKKKKTSNIRKCTSQPAKDLNDSLIHEVLQGWIDNKIIHCIPLNIESRCHFLALKVKIKNKRSITAHNHSWPAFIWKFHFSFRTWFPGEMSLSKNISPLKPSWRKHLFNRFHAGKCRNNFWFFYFKCYISSVTSE